MKTRFPLALALTGILAIGVTIMRTDLLPGRDGTWIVQRAQAEGMNHSFSATAKTRISCQGKTVLSDVKITHMQPNKCRMEYTSEPLKDVVIGMDGKNNWRFDPETGKLVVIGDAACGRAEDRLHLLLKNHRIGLVGRERVAGRDAYSLVVRPRDSARIIKRLWIDADAFVILGQEDYDSHGRVESSTRFTSIRFATDFPESLFHVPADAKTPVDHPALGKVMPLIKLCEEVGFTVREPGYVPSGYKLDACRLYSCPHKSAYLRYTDGVSSISIFESRVGNGCGNKSCEPMGPCRVRRADRGEIVSIESRGISLVVVGDPNTRELKKVAESLR